MVCLRGILLKGLIYKQDIQESLDHPVKRIEKARFFAEGSAGWAYDYGGDARTLAGLQIDWAHKTLHFPPGVPDADQQRTAQELFPDLPPNEGHETAYLRYWYGRILDYYRGTGTKIFFLRVPRARPALHRRSR